MTDVNKKIIDNLILLGDEQVKIGNFSLAIEYYKKYVGKNPKDALMHNRIGHLYGKINEYNYVEDQINYFKKALEIEPNYTTAIRNLALTYPLIGKNQEAIECFKRLFELGALPDDYFAYACLNIKLGNFEEGWKFYESRFLKKFGQTEYPQINKPRWEGQKILDKTLLVQYEQGFGDSIQFFRYLDIIKPLVKKIIFRVQNELKDLFKINIDCAEIVGTSTPIDGLDFDYHTPLMSLPLLMKTRIDNIPSYREYINADKNKSKYYKKEFFDNDSLKIGISWAGMQTGNFRRNILLKYFYPLTRLKNVKVYSFQKNYGVKQLEVLPKNVEIVDLGNTFNDFSDTAAAMSNLDLFITSDNALLNLAGSMGIKTFLLLNKNAEWRWFLDEETTPWYDTVKIFKKQNENDSWSLLIDRTIKEVQAL